MDDVELKLYLKKKFRRNFIIALSLFIVFALSWIVILKGSKSEKLPWLLRKNHEWNERVSRTLFSSDTLAPTFDRALATQPRVNGMIGLRDDPSFDLRTWQLKIQGNGKNLSLNLEDIKKFSHVELTAEFKCIEGWSNIVNWGGVRLAEVLRHYGLMSDFESRKGYVALATPNKKYFVGLDIETALHPQTLLAYEMNGQPLTLDHGAPLRLITPLKYGIKNIKRIGHIVVGPERPSDYWARYGYDWYSGH